MKNFKSLLVLMLAGIIVASCSTSNNVVNNHLISKRKYTKGFHFNKKGHFGSNNEQDLAKESDDQKNNENLAIVKEDVAVKTIKVEKQDGKAQSGSTINNTVERQMSSTQSVPQNKAVSSNLKKVEIPLLNDKVNKEVSEKGIAQEQTNAPMPGVDTGDPLMLIIAIILCLILPPVALGVFRGIDTLFWVDLILFLIAIGGFWFFSLAGLAGLVAVVLAFLGVFDVI